MKLKAVDTIHISSVQATPLQAGDTFEVSDADGKSLVDRGLATEVKASSPPSNKMDAAPANKAARKAKG